MRKDPETSASLTFDVHGTQLVNSEKLTANGAYKVTSNQNGQILISGTIKQVEGCCLTNDSSNGKPIRLVDNPGAPYIVISTSCSTSATNQIDISDYASGGDPVGHFQGPVECSPQGGNSTANQQQPSSMTGTTTKQDSEGDGIPDSSDRCASNSNQRCYEESK